MLLTVALFEKENLAQNCSDFRPNGTFTYSYQKMLSAMPILVPLALLPQARSHSLCSSVSLQNSKTPVIGGQVWPLLLVPCLLDTYWIWEVSA
jgi:hypothetical protein